jgi:TnpA family transposase
LMEKRSFQILPPEACSTPIQTAASAENSIGMPVDLLSEDQQRNYGKYSGDPSAAQLSRYFHLDDADRALIALRRGDQNRLGFAVQLCTVRFLGTFLPDLLQAPRVIVNLLASQLGILTNRRRLDEYMDQTRQDHAEEIRLQLGYLDFPRSRNIGVWFVGSIPARG